ncbi:MAG: hypothetical protein HC932_00590 [Thermales bacterium]|nr:hypothetical protein [Thermales bacterium]
MIKSVIDRLSVTINNQKVENVYEDKQLSKLRSEINKTVSSYSQTLYDFQVAAGVIQKGDSFDINNTMFLKKQGDDPKHPGYKKSAFLKLSKNK